MNTRFMAWTVVVMLSQGLAGCGGPNSSSAPLSPSTPSRPPLPPVAALAGNYVVTFEADRSCELPEALKTRTYQASIAYTGGGTAGTAAWFSADLNGAQFADDRGWGRRFMIKVTDDVMQFDFSDSFIVEKPEPGAYLMIVGGEGGAMVEPSNLSTVSTSFDGVFLYCVTNSEFKFPSGCPADAMTNSRCRSKNSRWTLTRR